jgi:hypothetical protein
MTKIEFLERKLFLLKQAIGLLCEEIKRLRTAIKNGN